MIEIFHGITEPARERCPKYMDVSKDERYQRVGLCNRPIKRLISGGCGVVMDSDRLWDAAPTPNNPRGEAKSNLKKSEAYLIGVPEKDREKHRRYRYGKENPRDEI